MASHSPHKVDLEMSKFRKYFIFCVGAVDCMLFGGAVFGWPQLVYTLKTEGMYADLCDSKSQEISDTIVTNSFIPTTLNCTQDLEGVANQTVTSSCPAQDEKMALIFTSAVVCFGVPGVFVGLLLHYAGLLVTRLTAGTAIIASFLCLSLATPESPDWLFPFMILLALGGNQTRMSVMQLGDLFPKYRSTAITFLTGIYAVSGTLFIAFQLFEDIGVSRPQVCYILVGIAAFTTLSSFAMPFHHVPHEESGQGKKSSNTISIKESLFTWSSFLHAYWLFISLFSINIFQQSYNLWITASFCTDEEIQFYSNLFSYQNLLSLFISPLLGLSTDFLTRRANKANLDGTERRINQIQASFISLFVTSLFVTLMYCCLFFFHSAAVIIALAAVAVVRAAVIAVTSAYIRNRFPATHFNRLMGVHCTVVSGLSFLQYYHFLWSMDSYYSSHAAMVILNIIAYVNPLHLLSKTYLRRQVRKQFPDITKLGNPILGNTGSKDT